MAQKPIKYRYYTKTDRLWTDESVKKALEEVDRGASVNSVSKKYHMSESKLRKDKEKRDGKIEQTRGYQGRKKLLPPEVEEDIAALIKAFARAGMGLRKMDIGEIIQDFCEAHEIDAWTANPPTKNYIIQFCERNNLTMRKEALLSISREEATKNPFVIMDFYDRLEECIQELRDKGVAEDSLANHIYNCDETCFPYDPNPIRVIGGAGEERPGQRAGEGRKNTTVLACASAGGHVFPPLVVFHLKNRPADSTLEGCIEGMDMDVSQKGWMTKELFQKWFTSFCQAIDLRPLLLLLDGHTSHVSVAVLEKAIAECIILLKLPPHTTDLVQPLDVVPFACLKSRWSDKLRDYVHAQRGVVTSPSRNEFCMFLSDLWADYFSPAIIESAFEKCGIWKFNPEKYPKHRFDPRLLKKYEKWVAIGKPGLDDNQYTEFITSLTPSPKKKAPAANSSRTPSPQAGPSWKSSESDRASVRRQLPTGIAVPKLPDADPVPGYDCPGPASEWVAEWQLRWVAQYVPRNPERPVSSRTPEEKTRDVTNMIISKKMGMTPTTHKKRKRAEIMTSQEYLEQQREKEERASKRASKQPAKGKPLPKKRPAKLVSSSESSQSDYSVHDSSSEPEVEYPPKGLEAVMVHLKFIWNSLKPPVLEDSLKGKYFALIYYKDWQQTKPLLFVGKLLMRFLDDEDGLPTTFQFDCLDITPHPGLIFKKPSTPDVDIFSAWDVIDGPLHVTPLKNGQFHIPQYEDLKAVFNQAIRIDRLNYALRLGFFADPKPPDVVPDVANAEPDQATSSH